MIPNIPPNHSAAWPSFLNNDELRERMIGKPVVQLPDNPFYLDDNGMMAFGQPIIEAELVEPEPPIMTRRLCKENAAYWRAYESPHIAWLQDHIDFLKKKIVDEFNNTSLQYGYLADIPDANECLMTSTECKFGLAEKQRQLYTWKKGREDYLDAAAKFVRFETFSATMHRLTSSPVAAYAGRGASSTDYALGQLMPYIKRLQSEGFSTHYACKEDRYVLWANCYEWMFDALCRGITLAEARAVFEAEKLDPNAYRSINHEGSYLRPTCNI